MEDRPEKKKKESWCKHVADVAEVEELRNILRNTLMNTLMTLLTFLHTSGLGHTHLRLESEYRYRLNSIMISWKNFSDSSSVEI